MSKKDVIDALSASALYAQCNKCGGEFKLADSLIFDGLEQFPENALMVKENMEQQFKQQMDDFDKKSKMVDEGAEQRALYVGFGKIMEKIIPAHKDFNVPLSDCRPLFEPIDMISFNGLYQNKIESLTFYEIKTGKSRLNKHERMIRDTVNDKRVFLREF